jgi:adenosylmethionine-8-amino-7-oxononanoate aminotransferase
MSFSDKDRSYIWHPYTSLGEAGDNIVISSAKGVYLYTDKGEKILDAISSWWVNLHGHSNEYINNALAAQASVLEHVIFAGFTHEPAIRLSERLLKILPGDQKKIFFSDNGSTAVEAAIKMAYQYWFNQGLKKKKIIALQGAFHGDTFGAMSAGERGAFSRPFQSLLFEAIHIDFPTKDNEEIVLKRFEDACSDEDVAAFIYEPLLQGASGMRIYSKEILNKMLHVAKKNNIVCIADEVFTGFGRTGKLFASEYAQEKPDIICLSKGLTGGYLPMGITACNEKILTPFVTSDKSKTFFHGHSYTANPLACSVALASLDLLLEEKCQKQILMISRMHREFQKQISGIKQVREVRTLGTLLALEIETQEKSGYFNSLRDHLYYSFLKKCLLLRPLGNVIYVLPPYPITESELKTVYSRILEVI